MESKQEGIFDVNRRNNGQGIYITERVAEGTVKSIEEATLHSQGKSYNIVGAYLELETSRGTDKVEFPRSLALSDRREILNQTVKYSFSTSHMPGEFNSKDYTLEILSGRFKGDVLKAI
ncbi:hypothetical protein KW805_02090 [Candidatus Pacearchaeota archaeon]|nr:hypothetical protein [Candidatus Pacearchaeota archaeon]